MAESQVVAERALKRLEDQLTCAICLDVFKDPKLLQCFHVYCKECLQRLVVEGQQGMRSVRCPTCRQQTHLPPKTADTSGLQSAFHIHHLFEIQDALEKVKEPQKIKCDKCKTPQPATSYCRDCGQFICAICVTVHKEWDVFAKHEVVAIGKLEHTVKQLDTLKKVTLCCPLHQDKELELYCETCGELVCHNCTVKKHKEHHYDLVSDTFERHSAEITTSLEPIEGHLNVVGNELEQLKFRTQELHEQCAANKAKVEQQIDHLVEILQARKGELISQLDKDFEMKLKNLAVQKDELETVYTKLSSCLSFVRDSLQTGSQGEIMKMKSTVLMQIKALTDNFKPVMLPRRESTDVIFTSATLTQACQQFGEVRLQSQKCYALGRGLEIAEPGKRATAVLHVVDHKGEASSIEVVDSLTTELVSDTTGEKIDCSVRKAEASQYEIRYRPTSRGRHQLHIKLEGDHIEGSPFPVTVKLPIKKLGTPIKTPIEVKWPRGVAVNRKGEVCVAEGDSHCVSIFSPTGERTQCFGSRGSGSGQFNGPRDVAEDSEGNVLVVDMDNHRIQKFTSDGKFISAVGGRGNKPLEFYRPVGVTVHPLSKKVYVADCSNHRIQILNPDFTFSSTFGSSGKSDGQFHYPWGEAFDSTGNAYVADCSNHRVQVFTAAGEYMRQFGKKGKGIGELSKPTAICIDSDNVVYITEYDNNRVSVFTCEGKFLTSFGGKGKGPGQFDKPRGIAIDRNGVVCVSDTSNNRLQSF